MHPISNKQPQTSIRDDNPLIGLVGILIGLYALQDLPCISASNRIEILEVTVPMRLSVYFAVLFIGYVWRQSSVNNSLVFSLMFFEMFLNFWMYTALREERNEQRKQMIRDLANAEAEQDVDKQD